MPRQSRIDASDSLYHIIIHKDAEDNYFIGWSAPTAMCPVK
jgi:hypothetical protein